MSNPWKLILPSVLLGILVGASGGAFLQRRMFMRPPDTERILRRLTGKLGLDAGQQTAARAVLEGRKEKMTALRQETMAKSRDIKSAMRDEIKKILRPDQLSTY